MAKDHMIIGSAEPARVVEPRYDGSLNVFPDIGKGDIAAVQPVIPAPFAGKTPLVNFRGSK